MSKKKEYFEYSITIREFVNDYLEVEHDCYGLTHRGLKTFNNPFVFGVSNEFAEKNPDCVFRKEVLVVYDSKKNKGTYLNPHFLRKLTDLETTLATIKVIGKVRIFELKDINEIYEQFKMISLEAEMLNKLYSGYYDVLKYTEKENVIDLIHEISKEEVKNQNIVKINKLSLTKKNFN